MSSAQPPGAEAKTGWTHSPRSAHSFDDVASFTAALSDVAPAALRLALAMGSESHEAADVVQEAAVAAWRYRASCNADFRAWFLAIVRRKVRTAPRRWLTLAVFWQPAGDGATFDEDGQLPAELKRLGRRQRAALWLRYGLDMSVADVAHVLGTTEPAAKQLLLRARMSLRHELERSAEEERQ